MALVIPFVSAWLDRKSRVVWVVWGVLTGCILSYGLGHYGRPIDLPYVGTMLAQVTRLLALWVFPVNLTIDHDWALITRQVGFLAMLIWISVFCVAAIKDFPRWSWVLASIAVWFIPRLFIPTAEGLHEHHLYTPSLALSLGTGYWLKGFA